MSASTHARSHADEIGSSLHESDHARRRAKNMLIVEHRARELAKPREEFTDARRRVRRKIGQLDARADDVFPFTPALEITGELAS
jgi:hypothetical protein